jgi:hypothetical protein
MTPKASLSSMRFWSEPYRPPNHPCHAADRGARERLFRILKPKLLTLRWFARLWAWFASLHDRIVR